MIMDCDEQSSPGAGPATSLMCYHGMHAKETRGLPSSRQMVQEREEVVE